MPFDLIEDIIKPAFETVVETVTDGIETLERLTSEVLSIITETISGTLDDLGIDLEGLQDFLEGLSENILKKLKELLEAFRELQSLFGNLNMEYTRIMILFNGRSLEKLMAGENVRLIWSLHERARRVQNALQLVFMALKALIDILPRDEKRVVWEMLERKDSRFKKWLNNS